MRHQAQLTRILLCQALTTTTLLASPDLAADKASAKEQEEAKASNFNAALPEGKTLPENVARFRVIHRVYEANKGFNEDGAATGIGLQYQGRVAALVGELGLTDRLSFRIMAPLFYHNSASLNQNQFKRSGLYKAKLEERLSKAAEELKKTQLCHTTEQCRKFIEKGESLPFTRDIVLDTGETFTLRAGTSIKSAIEQGILNAATPPKDGTVGLGDIETGFLYNFFRSERALLSTGLGMRLPTGNFNRPEMMRPISGRVADLGFRFNFDIAPIEGLWISFQEQIEHAVSKKTWKRASDLDNKSFNLADPADGGDGESNTRTYEKRGFTFDSLVKANYGFGELSPALKAFAMNVSYQNRKDRAIYLDNKEFKKATNLHSAGVGASVSGLGYKVPVEAEINYTVPFAGKDARLAPSMTETMLKVYTRF